MSTTYCTNCGAAIASGAFCTTCGTPASGEAADATPQASAQASPSTSNQTFNSARQPVASTNTLAIIALVTSLLGVHLAGIICGHIALSQIKTTGESGRGLALAGLIIGYVGVVVVVLFVAFWIAAIASISGGYVSA